PAGDLELDELVEMLEALVTADLGLRRSQETPERLLQVWPFAHVSSSNANPRSSRCLRSLRRASCNVLYKAPRVVFKRSASTSIGTPFNARATSTRRWCRASTSPIAPRSVVSSPPRSACAPRPGRPLVERAHGSGSSGTSRP